MTLTSKDIGRFIHQAYEASLREEQALNAADARLGDGDTGSMLRRVLGAMASVEPEAGSMVSETAMTYARVAMKETGSSLGSLVATCAMTLAKAAKQAEEAEGGLKTERLGKVVADMRDAVATRGKASIGDKTIVDSLDHIATELSEGPVSLETARSGATKALDDLRPSPCRIGRARMFPERSIGADDPGMLAVSLLLR